MVGASHFSELTAVKKADNEFVEKCYKEIRELFDGADLDKSGTMSAKELAVLVEKMWIAMGEPVGPKSVWVSRRGSTVRLAPAARLTPRTLPAGKLLSRERSLMQEVKYHMASFDTDGACSLLRNYYHCPLITHRDWPGDGELSFGEFVRMVTLPIITTRPIAPCLLRARPSGASHH